MRLEARKLDILSAIYSLTSNSSFYLPLSIFKKMMKILKTNRFFVLLLFFVFLLRLPSFFEPYWYGDENIYLTIGMSLRKGLLLYRDIFDNKPPLIYFIAAVANGRIFWFRLILSFFVLASIYFFHLLSRVFFEKSSKTVKITTVLFAILTTIRTFEGNIPNAELFILLPTIASFYLILSEKVKKPAGYFAAGIIFSLGFLFKVPAVSDFVALFSFLIFFGKKLITFNRKTLMFILGYLSPIILTGFFFWTRGAFKILVESTFLQTMGYLSSWQTGSHSFSLTSLIKSGMLIKALFVFVVFVILWWRKTKINKFLLLTSLWFIFSLFSATLAGRPYPHYLIQTLPPLCLAAGFLLSLKKPLNILLPLCVFTLFGVSFAYYRFWFYPTGSYYLNFLQFAVGQKNKQAYFSYFNPSLVKIYETAEFISANSKPRDKIFIWGDEPGLYPLSKRTPSTPYLVKYHIVDLNLYQKTADLLTSAMPTIVVLDKNALPFHFLESLVETKYFYLERIGNFEVFRVKSL